MGHPLQYRPHQLGSTAAPGQPDEGAPGPEVPHRCAQTQQGRDEPHVPGVVAPGGHLRRIGGVGAEAVRRRLLHLDFRHGGVPARHQDARQRTHRDQQSGRAKDHETPAAKDSDEIRQTVLPMLNDRRLKPGSRTSQSFHIVFKSIVGLKPATA